MTKPFEPIPASQLFRTLLIHMLETHRVLTPYVRHTTSKELKWCHQQNVYILSEIESWLEDLTEDTDLTPSFSPAHAAELQAGLASCLAPPPIQLPPGAATTPDASAVPPATRRGSPPARSSPRAARTLPALERNSLGQIIFRAKS